MADLKSISTLTARLAKMAARASEASTALAPKAAAAVQTMDWDDRALLLARLHKASGRTAESLSQAFSSATIDTNTPEGRSE